MAIICLAPLQGVTDRIYRNLFPVYFQGVDYAIAPFVPATKKMKPDYPALRELSLDRNTGMTVIPQIMASQPGDFIRIANWLYDMGHTTVNWNLGCPFRMVVKKGRGAGMLCYPDRVESFLEKAMPELKPQLSIKIRIGLKNPEDALELMPIFNRIPLTELIIHPRTGAQMYQGEVDPDMFEQCLGLSKHPVVYNGDIDSLKKWQALAGRFGKVERWMIGRGLIGNPFLAEEIKCDSIKPYPEKVRIMRAFHDHLFAEYSQMLSGPAHITNKMKEIWTYMAAFFENGEKARKRINKTHHPEHYVDVINQVFDEAASGRESARAFPGAHEIF